MKKKLRRHYNYYCIAENREDIRQFFDGVMKIWYRWLNRSSQHRSYTLQGFKEMNKKTRDSKTTVVEQWWIKPSVQYCLKFAWGGSEIY